MVILIDNYDSFVHNLARYIGCLGFERVVYRNDALSVTQLAALNPSHLILSPGPGTPFDAGISIAAIQYFTGRIPILGVCLGHQAIAAAFGGQIKRAQRPLHGESSLITHTQQGVFKGLPTPFTVGRYHSLIACPETLPSVLSITAYSAEQEIMALAHKTFPVYGVQFHPESILTEHGEGLLRNFLSERG